MRRIGAHVSVAGGLGNALKNAQEIGSNCLQIFAGSPRTWARSLYLDKDVLEFKAQSQALDITPLFIHALYLVNLASDQMEIVNKSATSLRYDLQNGDALGAVGVVVHLGSHQGRGFASAKEQLIQSINSLLNESKTTRFLIENSAGQNGKIGTLEEVRDLIEQISHPRLGICLDTAHLFASGFDLRQKNEVDKLIAQLTSYNLLDKVTCLHLNDSKSALNSHRDLHANLGEGEIGLTGLAQFINHPKLIHLPVFLEVPGANGWPDKANIDIAKSL